MINIFDQKSVPEKGADLSSPYVTRLKQLARTMEGGTAAVSATAAAPAPAAAANGNGADTAPASDANGDGQPAEGTATNRRDFGGDARELAEQIAPRFVEALSSVFEEVNHLTSDSRRNVQSAMLYTAKLSARMESLVNEFTSVRQRVDAVVVADREQDGHMARLNEHLSEYERLFLSLQEQVRQLEQRVEIQQGLIKDRLAEAVADISQIRERLEAADQSAAEASATWSKIQEGQQMLESRQARQADAIRSLHDMIASQSEQQDQLRTTLQRLCEVTTSHTALRPLPENL